MHSLGERGILQKERPKALGCQFPTPQSERYSIAYKGINEAGSITDL